MGNDDFTQEMMVVADIMQERFGAKLTIASTGETLCTVEGFNHFGGMVIGSYECVAYYLSMTRKAFKKRRVECLDRKSMSRVMGDMFGLLNPRGLLNGQALKIGITLEELFLLCTLETEYQDIDEEFRLRGG